MDELEALNMLLRLIGSTPVVDITTKHPDVANALTTLTRIRKQAHKRGWWFNIDYNVVFQPQANKEIIIAKEIISFVATADSSLVIRNGKLYDKLNQTYQFECDITAKRITRILEWDDMPNSMRDYCAYLAGVSYVRDELEDPAKQREIGLDAGLALIELRRDDLQQGRYNAFNSSRTLRARSGVQPYGRRSSRTGGDTFV